MIKKPAGYDEAAAYTGESQQLPKGKYVCVIKQVATQTSKNGYEQFVILYDIADGEHKDFYKKLFDVDKAQNPSNAKWRGVFKQNMEGKGLSWFKGIITSIERSNNFTFQWELVLRNLCFAEIYLLKIDTYSFCLGFSIELHNKILSLKVKDT